MELVKLPESIVIGTQSGESQNARQNKEPMSEEEKRNRARVRAEKTVRRLINTNNFQMMWTLTFALKDTKKRKWRFLATPEQQRDRDFVLKAWARFARRMKERCKEKRKVFRYVCVLELHDGTKTHADKRGTFHLHFASDLQWKKRSLEQIWGYGMVHFDDFSKPKKGYSDESSEVKERGENVRNPGAYMSKYISKNFDEGSGYKEKSYCSSRNLKKPVKIAEQEHLEPLLVPECEQNFFTEHVLEFDGKTVTITKQTLFLDRGFDNLLPGACCPAKRTTKGQKRHEYNERRRETCTRRASREHQKTTGDALPF